MGAQAAQPLTGPESCPVDPPHPMLHSTRLLNAPGHPRIRAQWPFFSQEAFELWRRNYRAFLNKLFRKSQLSEVDSPLADLLFLPISAEYSRIQVCSPSGIVSMEYQAMRLTLNQEVERRGKDNDPFLENQLWALLHLFCSLACFLHQKGFALGDLRSENVFVDPEEGKVKLATEFSWISELSFKDKILKRWKVFVSPQIAAQQARGGQLTEDLLLNNDAFSIGVLLAQTILLENLSNLYSSTEGVTHISVEKYDTLLQDLLCTKYYSNNLLLVVAGLLRWQPSDRLFPQQVASLLRDKENQIDEGRPLTINKHQFMRVCPQKYESLCHLSGEVRAQLSKRSQDSHLRFSRSFTINDVSAVDYVRRTYNQTFNVGLIGDSEQSKPRKLFQPSQKDIQGSPVAPFSGVKEDSSLLLDPQFYVVSGAKESSQQPAACLARKLYEPLSDLKVLDRNSGISNFSFQSPQGQPKEEMKSKDPSEEYAKSTETLLLPSIYSVSNPPDSLISYHYSKSVNRGKPTIKEEQDLSFLFEKDLYLKGRKKSEELEGLSVPSDNFRRRTAMTPDNSRKEG